MPNRVDALKVAIVASGVRSLAYSSVSAFFIVVSTEKLGLSVELSTELLFASMLVGSVFFAIGGSISDNLGNKLGSMLGAFIQSVSLLMLSFAFEIDCPTLLAIGVIMQSVGSSLLQASLNAVVAYSGSPENRIKDFASIRTAVNLGFAIGPAFGGAVIEESGYSVLLFVYAIAVFALIFMSGVLMQGKTTVVNGSAVQSQFIGNSLLVIIAGFLLATLFGQFSGTLPLYERLINNLNYVALGELWGVNGILVIFLQYPIANIIKDSSSRLSLVGGSLIYSAGIIVLAFAVTFTAVLASVVVMSVGEVLFWSTAQAFVLARTGVKNKATYLGLWNFVISLGRAVGLAYGPFLFLELNSHVMLWLILAFPGIVSAALFYISAGQPGPSHYGS